MYDNIKAINMNDIEYIVWHCSATKRGKRLTFEDCRDMHAAKGWNDIGYHVYVEIDGSVKFGRSFKTPGAHARGFNHESIGICYEGGLDEKGKPLDTRTPQQKQAMLTLRMLMGFMFPKAEHVGHRDLSPDLNGDGIIQENEWMKQCPCFDVKSEYK